MEVRGHAAYSLGKLGDERAIEPLTNALSDVDESVRKFAFRALGEFLK
jgi:HEAT repeat protein